MTRVAVSVIPVRNLYYLLCYAWNRLEAADLIDVSAVSFDRVQDLFAHVLAAGTRRLIRRGLDRGYIEHPEDTSVPRGKLLVSETCKRRLYQHGRVACAPDALSHDVLHNRLLRTTLRHLSEANIDPDLSRHLGSLVSRFTDVTEVEPSASLFRRLQFHRTNSHYAFLLHVCELVHRCLLVDPATGHYRFHDFRGDEQEMGRLFQAFIRNFLHREQETFVVSAERLQWDALSTTEADARWLPAMQTDISLASARRRVIIETKYYREPFQLRWSERPTLRSDHLYQLFAYLKNAGRLGDAASSPAGVLLYAAAGQHLNLRYRLAGHDVFVRTLDLGQPWQGIRADVLAFVDDLT